MAPPGLLEVGLLVACGLAAGTAGAVLGTGGGVFLIPILLLGFGVPIRYAVGTSILTVVATSTAVAIGNLDRCIANMRLGMTLEIATSLGAVTGGLSAEYLPAGVLETVFAVVLLPTAYAMWRGRGEEGGPSTDAAADQATDSSAPA